MNIKKTTDFASRCVLFAGLMLPLAAYATTVTGTVTNKTTGRPDAKDKVVLLSLSQGMQPVASTKPDAQGHFSFNLPDNNTHLIRVTHQQASYYEPVPPGTTHVNVTVYDVASKVRGVRTEADVLRVQTGSQGLEVIENYFVENTSKPPKTQFSSEAYPIYLPPNAQVQGAQAEGPQGMPVSISPVPLSGKGHYAFVFPIRPGETRFGVSYLIPNYSGSLQFNPKVSLETGNLAVMLPNSMSFQSSNSAFQQIQDPKVKAQTFVAKDVKPGQKLSFTVSGTGEMPQDLQAQSGSQSGSQSQAEAGSSSSSDRPGGGLGPPIDSPGPLHKYRWWILSALGLVMVVIAAFLLGGKKNVQDTEPEENPLTPTVASGADGAPSAKSPPAPGQQTPAAKPSSSAAAKSVSAAGAGSSTLLQALKEELFAVESERVEGKLTEAQYAEVKGALEVVLRRALGRKG